VSSIARSKPAEQRWELRQRSLPELFDIAFALYRDHFKTYLLALALPSFLWLFGGILFLANSDIDDGIIVLAFAGRPQTVGRDVVIFSIFRELCFADGTFLWTLMATAFAPATAQAYLSGRLAWREIKWAPGKSVVLALLATVPVVVLRVIGLGPLAELGRLPTLLAPQVMTIERTSLPRALWRSWHLIWRDALRVLVLFIPALALVRLAIASPFIGLALLNRWALWAPMLQLGFLIPLCALAAELFICAVTHIAISLLYYELRIRREGLDIALTAAEDSATISAEA
jgi:hypothetical protein